MNGLLPSLLRLRIMKMKRFLPSSLYILVSRLNYEEGLTKSQLNKIKLLGESVGLTQDEVIAALDRPLSPMGLGGKQKIAIYFTMFVATAMIIIGSLFIWAVLDPETAPIHTYVPGTFYGTIQPKDFAIFRTP